MEKKTNWKLTILQRLIQRVCIDTIIIDRLLIREESIPDNFPETRRELTQTIQNEARNKATFIYKFSVKARACVRARWKI